MSETPTSELRELAKGSTVNPPVVKDRNNKEWTLLPLDLSDLVDYEETVGTSLFTGKGDGVKTKDIMFLMYLSLRKTGCSDADLEAKKYAFASFRAFLRSFNLKAFVDSATALADLMKMSGLDSAEGNPPPANQ